MSRLLHIYSGGRSQSLDTLLAAEEFDEMVESFEEDNLVSLQWTPIRTWQKGMVRGSFSGLDSMRTFDVEPRHILQKGERVPYGVIVEMHRYEAPLYRGVGRKKHYIPGNEDKMKTVMSLRPVLDGIVVSSQDVETVENYAQEALLSLVLSRKVRGKRLAHIYHDPSSKEIAELVKEETRKIIKHDEFASLGVTDPDQLSILRNMVMSHALIVSPLSELEEKLKVPVRVGEPKVKEDYERIYWDGVANHFISIEKIIQKGRRGNALVQPAIRNGNSTQLKEARDLLQEAYEVAPTEQFLYNLAVANILLGDIGRLREMRDRVVGKFDRQLEQMYQVCVDDYSLSNRDTVYATQFSRAALPVILTRQINDDIKRFQNRDYLRNNLRVHNLSLVDAALLYTTIHAKEAHNLYEKVKPFSKFRPFIPSLRKGIMDEIEIRYNNSQDPLFKATEAKKMAFYSTVEKQSLRWSKLAHLHLSSLAKESEGKERASHVLDMAAMAFRVFNVYNRTGDQDNARDWLGKHIQEAEEGFLAYDPENKRDADRRFHTALRLSKAYHYFQDEVHNKPYAEPFIDQQIKVAQIRHDHSDVNNFTLNLARVVELYDKKIKLYSDGVKSERIVELMREQKGYLEHLIGITESSQLKGPQKFTSLKDLKQMRSQHLGQELHSYKAMLGGVQLDIALMEKDKDALKTAAGYLQEAVDAGHSESLTNLFFSYVALHQKEEADKARNQLSEAPNSSFVDGVYFMEFEDRPQLNFGAVQGRDAWLHLMSSRM